MPNRVPSNLARSLHIAAITGSSCYLLLASEWLFQATKPSFLSPLALGEQLRVLLRAPLLPAVLLALSAAVLALTMLPLRVPLGRIAELLPCLPAAAILAGWCLLLVENFSRTVVDFGVEDGGWLTRLLYAAGLLGVVAWWLRVLRRTGSRRWPVAFLGCLALSAMSTLWPSHLRRDAALPDGLSPTHAELARPDAQRPAEHYNILLVGSDGLAARDLELYGQGDFATPFLQSLVPESLLAENAFVNSAHTGAAVASMLSGKLPSTTRLIFPPDILRDQDASEHLPRLLSDLGYRAIQASERHYADALDLNLQGGFLEVNGRATGQRLPLTGPDVRSGSPEAYFRQLVISRLQARLGALLGKPARRAFVTVQRGEGGLDDEQRLERFFAFVEAEDGPFFAHLHLMGTHGRLYGPGSVRTFDRQVESLLRFLQRREQLEQTIVVVHTDHGPSHAVHRRVPLLIRFPHGDHAGRLRNNVQILDIAPTLLEALGLTIPSWMEGRSMLLGEPEAMRPLFSTAGRPGTSVHLPGQGRRMLERYRMQAPYFSLGVISAAICQRVYRLHLHENRLRVLRSKGHTKPCASNTLPPREAARELLRQHLLERGYEVSQARPAEP